jgi:hypothetical protein
MRETSPTATAEEICKLLVSSFENREGVFADTKELLENQIPTGVEPLGLEHANFLFFLISQDHGVKSSRLYERAKELYSREPQNFDPKSISSRFGEADFENAISILQALGVRYPKNGARSWVQNAHVLTREYHADARQLFRGDSQTVIRRIRSLLGFGPKTGGLLFRVFVGLTLYSPSDDARIAFPTDIHDTRIAALTGLADIPVNITESTYSPYVKAAEEVWRRGSLEAPVNWFQLDRALWILGSKGCATERHFDCPIRQHCQIGRNQLL